jgi:soluble lytic murein transglycosylase
MKTRTLLPLLALALIAIACNLNASLPFLGPTATPRPSATPSATPTPLPTATPTPTPTPIPAMRIQNGDMALFDGDWDTALQEYQTARQAAGGDANIQAAALLGIGRTQVEAGKYQDAVNTLQELIKSYPNAPQVPAAKFTLAQAYNGLQQYTDSAQAYLEYMAQRPGIIDGYVLDLRGDALFAAGSYTEAAKDFQAALQAPSLNDSSLLQMKLARSYSVGGDSATALTLYDDLYQRSSDDFTKALIDLRKGQIYTDLGQMDQAYAAYQDAVNNYPTSYDSYSCLLALVDAGVPVDELNRGLVDYFAGQYGVAQAAFDRYLQDNPPDPGTALYYYGLATRALGNYQGAINEWDQLIQGFPDHRYWDDAWEQKAYTQWFYLDQNTAAIQTLLDFVSAVPSNPRAGEFLFDAAQVAARNNDLVQAAQLWARVASEYPSYDQASRALFLAGLMRYRLKDYDVAAQTFQHLLETAPALQDRAAASFWIGKTQMAQGDAQAADTTWQVTAGIDPTGYYSERALDLTRNRQPFTPPQTYDLGVDLAAERQQADDWVRKTFSVPADTSLSGLGPLAGDGYIQRGTELWNLGMYSQARQEFEQLRQQLQNDAVGSYRLANYLVELGVYRSATLAVRQVLTLAGMDDAATLSAPLYFNHLRFGTYFSDLIRPAAQKYNFNPLFLFSVVRQESLFESFATSSAAAGGLMQIVPATGAEIAKNLGWPPGYQDADRYRPIVNVNLGADYLETQRKNFNGDLYAALAAYNGGPGNAADWKQMAPDDPDLFLEIIPYSETRNYIRGIYEIFNIYRRIYNRTP